MSTYSELKETVIAMEGDVNKFFDGTNSAGSRARKQLQAVKKLSQQLRTEIQNEKKKRKEA